jgi:hypothetical protein
MESPMATTLLLDQSPQTIDEYAARVQNLLRAAAMDLRQQGTAELRLAIGKDGSIRHTEIVEPDGAAADASWVVCSSSKIMGLLRSRPDRRLCLGAGADQASNGADGTQAALLRRAIYLSMSTIGVDLSS